MDVSVSFWWLGGFVDGYVDRCLLFGLKYGWVCR